MSYNPVLSATGGGEMMMIVVMLVVMIAFYFIMFRRQNKEQKQHDAMVNSAEVGDSIITTSGFYGVIQDVTDEVVIVEFGNNKNCRIPMKKEHIAEIEKASK